MEAGGGADHDRHTALGSHLNFVQGVLDPTYGAAPRAWGLVDPLTDQSIAGGALWSMGDLAYIVAGLALVGRWLLRQRGPQDLSDGGLEGPGSAR